MKQAAFLAALALGGCVTTSGAMATTEEVLEGNPAGYPAFLDAARACAFSAYRQVGDGSGGTHYLVTFPYENKRPYTMEPASLCVINWVQKNPQTGLVLSGH